MNKFAYVCFMANDRDLKGVLVNNYQLRKLNSKYPLVCLVTKLVSKESLSTLKKFNINVLNINFYDNLIKFKIEKDKIDFLFRKFYFGKLFIFLISQFEKLIYLDTDLLILKNIDHLFEKELKNNTMEMTCDTLMTKQNEKKYKIIKTIGTFNSGVILFKPNNNIFIKICNLINATELENIKKLWLTDQDIFNYLHKKKIIQINLLDYKYNVIAGVLDHHICNNILLIEDISIVHFILQPKPWANIFNRTIFGNIEKYYLITWLNIYNKIVEENLKYSNIEFSKEIINKI